VKFRLSIFSLALNFILAMLSKLLGASELNERQIGMACAAVRAGAS
jgi:hypothetical protein